MKRNITLQFDDENDWAIVLATINSRVVKGNLGDTVQVIRARAVADICRELQTVNGLGERHVDLPAQAKLPMEKS